MQKVETCFGKNPNVIVCVSEGIHDQEGTFICEYDNSVGTDTFGLKCWLVMANTWKIW